MSQPFDADVDSGEFIAAQLPQVLLSYDASHGSQVRSCSGEPSRGDQDLGRGQDAVSAAAHTALDRLSLREHSSELRCVAGEVVWGHLGHGTSSVGWHLCTESADWG